MTYLPSSPHLLKVPVPPNSILGWEASLWDTRSKPSASLALLVIPSALTPSLLWYLWSHEFLLPLSSSSTSLSSFAQPRRTALVQGPAVAISSHIPHCRHWPWEFTQPGASDDGCVLITPTPLVPAQTAFLGVGYFQLPAAENMKWSPKRTILEWAEMGWIKIKQ